MKIDPKITFFLNISTLLQKLLNRLFPCFSNLGPGMAQLKCQRAKRLKFSLPRFKTLKVGNFCTLNEEWLIPGAL